MGDLAAILVSYGTETFTRAEPFTMGSKRAGQASVLLDDEYVSDMHARFWWQDGRWWVEDLGSTNGIRIADGPGRFYGPGSRVYGRRALAKGDRLLIGHTVVTVVPA
jgi:pSer/pThr/pTyr-binding forkhead associated (FHA) protein